MSLPIRLHCIFLGALVTFPFFLSMFAAEVLFNAGEISQCPSRVVVDASRLGAYINPFSNLSGGSLPELPWKIVASSVQLKVLVPLKPFVTDLTHKSVGCHQRCWR